MDATQKAIFTGFMHSLKRAIPRYSPELSEALLETWARQLGDIPKAELGDLHQRAIARFDQFPSIRELLDLAGRAPATEQDRGREVAERIAAGVAKFGGILGGGARTADKWGEIMAYLGPVGTAVVQMQGGWNGVCDTLTYDNAPSLKAQWRELAAGLIRKERTGDVAAPPDFDRIDAPPRPLELKPGSHA